MAGQAHVGSIEDIARFRAQLLTFLSGARVAVEECSLDVAQQQSWLDHDRRRHWEAEERRRQRKLEEARHSLFQESLASQTGPSSWQQLQVHRAERSLDEARNKLSQIRTWSRSFENRSLPMVKQVERLHTFLATDMVRAVNFLNQSLAALDSYTSRNQVAPPPASTSLEPADPAPDSTAEIPAPAVKTES